MSNTRKAPGPPIPKGNGAPAESEVPDPPANVRIVTRIEDGNPIVYILDAATGRVVLSFGPSSALRFSALITDAVAHLLDQARPAKPRPSILVPPAGMRVH
jgi:hypothetical protein